MHAEIGAGRLTCLMREAKTLSMVKILYASCTRSYQMPVHVDSKQEKTCMQPKHLAHLIFKHKLFHLIIEQPFATLQHEFIILHSSDLSLSLLLYRRRLHQFDIHGRGMGVCVEGRVIHAFD